MVIAANGMRADKNVKVAQKVEGSGQHIDNTYERQRWGQVLHTSIVTNFFSCYKRTVAYDFFKPFLF